MTEPLTPKFKAQILRDAKVATQGEWELRVYRLVDSPEGNRVARNVSVATARHITNCSPENVRALLDENAALEAEQNAYLFQPWVRERSLAIQGTLATAVRGPDGCPKVDPAKEIVQAYRWATMNNAHKGTEIDCPVHGGYEEDGFDCPYDHSSPGKVLRPKHGDTFMGNWTGMASDDAMHSFLKSHDQYPHHWLMHQIHCAEIVGYLHPNKRIRTWWNRLYTEFCNAFHMNRETKEQMLERLQERS